MKYALKYIPGILVTLVMILGLAVGVYLLSRETEFFPRATGESADLIINLSDSFPTSDNWQYFSQGGENDERMLKNVVSEIKDLKAKYIRIDHIYDHYNLVSRSLDGSLRFDWSELDEAVDDIT